MHEQPLQVMTKSWRNAVVSPRIEKRQRRKGVAKSMTIHLSPVSGSRYAAENGLASHTKTHNNVMRRHYEC